MIKIKILKYLIENKQANIRTISKALKINYSNTYQTIKKLEEVNIQKLGNNNIITLKNKITPNIYQAEYNRKLFFLKSEDIRNIHRKLNNPFSIVLLFGSRLKNNASNDIDICIIEDNHQTNLDTLSYSIDQHIFTKKQFQEMIKIKTPNLGNEIIKQNIILKGIENYYELINSTIPT